MQVQAVIERFPLARVFTISRGSKTHAEVITVTITDGDFVGRGECVPYARYGETLESVLAQIEGARFADRASLQHALPHGAARNALDCALWDLEAKRAGRRIWELVGEPAPEGIVTAFTLSLGSPEAMERQAAENATRPVLKIKLGTPDDLPRLEAVRRGAPDAALIIDANEGWSEQDYLTLLPHLERLGVVLVEQPFPAGKDSALETLPRPVPICADESCHVESDLFALRNRYDFVNIKLDKAGGLSESLRLRDAAVAAGFGVMVGCMVGSSLAMAPAMVLAHGAGFVDLDGPLLLARDRENAIPFQGSELGRYSSALWG
ncbi:dipeptide epimerase [Marivivens sp. LCG002]|uniref:N-acetyl-D-Glu racemase DgcA n=1 Tax=Marivivens sp. LCG002 TaxID=3051171 RepID=UPI002555F0B4|nr:N-acetyl-D-Glu racemase DgcA [Marivivens sp. LCG002]WIV50531.1 dipeptide epimerase [Marivivens sp. LCG002]